MAAETRRGNNEEDLAEEDRTGLFFQVLVLKVTIHVTSRKCVLVFSVSELASPVSS